MSTKILCDSCGEELPMAGNHHSDWKFNTKGIEDKFRIAVIIARPACTPAADLCEPCSVRIIKAKVTAMIP